MPVWLEEKLKELEEPKYEYGGKQLTEYEASQVQRYNERQIRRWQREYAAMEAAGLDTSEAAAKLRHWQGVQADFVNKTELVRQYEREQITVANPMKYGIINDIDDEIFEITEEAIENVPEISFQGLTREASKRLHEQHKALLTEAMKEPVGTEVVFICDLNGVAQQKSVGSIGHSSVPSVDYEHLILHNHPDCRTFSGSDIEKLIMRAETKGIFAIGNDGTVYSAIKQENYDGFAAYISFKDVNERLSECVAKNDVEGYVLTIREYLKGAKQFGIEFVERTATRT